MEKPQNYLSRLRRHPLLWNLALIAAIILAMAVAAHILMQLGTRHGARRTVPDLSGVQLDQAQRIARKHDLQLHINDSLFVPAYEGGIVLDQLPEGGVEVKPGRTVYITINSFRQKMVPVPYVAGRSLRQAKNMLEIAGLEIGELIYRADMATNYVMEEYGQPMHAYDLDTIAGHEIVVRRAAKDEKFTTLDGQERSLDPSMLVIADPEKAVAIAGVMGGENSMIVEGSQAVLFESANFDGPNVRITAKKVGLRTDAPSNTEFRTNQLEPANNIL